MSKRLLIIEDDEELCEEMADILRDKGYSVDVAFDGVIGDKILSENQYDLILLDIKIPGMNGLDVLRSAKAKRENLKVIIMSGRPLAKKRHTPERAPKKEEETLSLADAFINKPFDVEKVLSKIEELTG